MGLVVERPGYKHAGLGCLGELGRFTTVAGKERPLPQSARTYVGVCISYPVYTRQAYVGSQVMAYPTPNGTDLR